ncbi:MAG: SH3 domain-containing protein [Planctomycetota bacterium]
MRLRQTASSAPVFVTCATRPSRSSRTTGSRWIEVRIPAPQGYVHQSKLARVGARGAARIVRVEPSHLKLRREPGMQGFVQGYLLGGTELRATGVQRGWVRIEEQRAIEGYVVREAIALPAAASR